jgi:hypothetical protein
MTWAPSAGCIRINGGKGVFVEACAFVASRPVTLLNVIDARVRDCVFSTGDGSINPGIDQQYSIGIHCLTNNGEISNCDFSGFFKAINLQQFISIRDSRIEMCDRGIVVGENETGDLVGGAAIIDGMQMEANNIHIHLAASGNTSIRSVGILGDPFTGILDDPRRPGQVGLLVQRATRLTVMNLDSTHRRIMTEALGIRFRFTCWVRHRRLPPSRISCCALYLNRGHRWRNQSVRFGDSPHRQGTYSDEEIAFYFSIHKSCQFIFLNLTMAHTETDTPVAGHSSFGGAL